MDDLIVLSPARILQILPHFPLSHGIPRDDDRKIISGIIFVITPCIPSKTNGKVPILHDKLLYRQRHRTENMFGRLKDWRRIHLRYGRGVHTFFSAIAIPANVILWI